MLSTTCTRRTFASALLLLSACASAGGRRTDGGAYDVVISGGRIVDGTGNPWFYGDVGIRGDRIARIAPRGMLAIVAADRRFDATELIVAPGRPAARCARDADAPR